MKIALAQINPIIGAFEKNSQKMLSFIEEAKRKKADLVIFPELSLVGYPPLDLLDKEHFVNDNLKYFQKLVSQIKDISAIIGFVDKNPQKIGKPFFNAAALVSKGKVLTRHYKILLPSYDVFSETRHFNPGTKFSLGELHKTKMILSICEDIWNDKTFWKRPLYKEDPLSLLKRIHPSYLINISASPYSMDKQKLRLEMIKAIAKKYKTKVIYVNQVGSNDELIFDGGSFSLDEKGHFLAQCKDFEEDLAIFDTQTQEGEKHLWSSSTIESLYKALVLGIKDYVSKCGFKKVLIGLSGGIDSAVTATLAQHAMGAQNVIGILMPSPYSSESSIEDAENLARNLNIRTENIPIHSIFNSYRESLKPLLDNQSSSLTEENLQARIRGTLLMALSNQWHALLLSTGNKSELGTGYCTLYGDMSGGLAVISDVPKTLIYKLAYFMNEKIPQIPQNSLTKPPSAELRLNQKDTDTLPPYDQLDPILKAYIEEHKPLAHIIRSGISKQIAQDIICRIDRNEYKRRQAPPGLRVTHKAFGLGRRFPIAQQYEET